MSEVLALPAHKDEAWRYADLEALAALWPLPDAEAVVVPANGAFARAVVQDAGGVTRLNLTLERGARAAVHVLNTGAVFGRVELAVTLHEGADFTLGAAQLGGGEATLEVVATVRHAEPGATSRQVVRSVLAGRATGTCLARVEVAKGAVGTDAVQSIRAMLLDRTATANAKPELEIFADDVKCAHGCAVGELDPAGLFYMASRGIAPAEAKKLMLQAFIAEAFVGAQAEERLLALALHALGALV
ncbi:MAG: SufD family Fe-S cluster assembly protein [Sphingomonadales bacterium]|nr:SufD family Fe-S cluster assembly protein [Sphingomonadales bacterium]